jgi:hypothetical protein
MLNAVVDLEREVKELKKRIQAGEMVDSDLDRLTAIREDIQAIQPGT